MAQLCKSVNAPTVELADFLVTTLDAAVRSKKSQEFRAGRLRRGGSCAGRLLAGPTAAGTDPRRAHAPCRLRRTTRFPGDRVDLLPTFSDTGPLLVSMAGGGSRSYPGRTDPMTASSVVGVPHRITHPARGDRRTGRYPRPDDLCDSTLDATRLSGRALALWLDRAGTTLCPTESPHVRRREPMPELRR